MKKLWFFDRRKSHSVHNKSKILFVSGFLLGLFTLLIFLGISGVSNIVTNLDGVVGHNLDSIARISDISIRTEKITCDLFDFMIMAHTIEKGKLDIPKITKIKLSDLNQIQKDLVYFRDNLSEKDQIENINKSLTILEQYKETVKFVFSMLEIDLPSALSFLNQYQSVLEEVYNNFNTIMANSLKDAKQSAYNSSKLANETILKVIFLAIILIGFIAFIGWYLLKVINEKHLANARDQNPLTQLPGNNAITTFINEALLDDSEYVLVYFDLNNFKPFNDTFGFRQGDRAILMFAETLRKSSSNFIGHIGGDDFFIGLKTNLDDARLLVSEILDKFTHNMESFYSPEIRQSKQYSGHDREGNFKLFPLLSCSAAMILIPTGERTKTIDQIISQIADIKSDAKNSPDNIAITILNNIKFKETNAII